ncbi:disease resistance protein RGA5-like isoform X1 [Triticum urartu]|uniref:disease resistance protein RGA5-like isoform X1 n=1 Tax=Triticum urartu TaxID=4572 RepID=UPI0020448B8A|nr:disease resistance protein RGA5-like isoform X1 [Triticum urartu]
MVGIMVSASTGVMNSLLGKLATLMGDEFAKLKNLRKEVKYISDELSSMKDALESLADLDELDIQTARWRDAVREMSYDIEDIIDGFMSKIGEKRKKSGFVHDTIQRLRTSRARHQIAGQIEDIKKLVRETSERRDRYKVDVPTSHNVAVDQRVVALYENAAKLVGMEGPTNEVVSWLKDEDKQLKVVSIVGFGGLGKTTLANEVYHKLKAEFHCSAFVPVSQKPNIPKLLNSLLTQLGCGQPFHDCELNVLLDQLRENLKNKRYLVIIDDLWDVSAWNIIKCVFPENNLGSRLIVTTRIKTLAEACCFGHHEHILEMKPLSEEESRKLFFGRISGSEEACSGQLRDVSVQILKKCGGLPLAIISISGLLASESSDQKEKWKYVLNSLGSVSGTNLTLEAMRQILNLSYKNLPHHLKTCFLYLDGGAEQGQHTAPVPRGASSRSHSARSGCCSTAAAPVSATTGLASQPELQGQEPDLPAAQARRHVFLICSSAGLTIAGSCTFGGALQPGSFCMAPLSAGLAHALVRALTIRRPAGLQRRMGARSSPCSWCTRSPGFPSSTGCLHCLRASVSSRRCSHGLLHVPLRRSTTGLGSRCVVGVLFCLAAFVCYTYNDCHNSGLGPGRLHRRHKLTYHSGHRTFKPRWRSLGSIVLVTCTRLTTRHPRHLMPCLLLSAYGTVGSVTLTAARRPLFFASSSFHMIVIAMIPLCVMRVKWANMCTCLLARLLLVALFPLSCYIVICGHHLPLVCLVLSTILYS